MKTNQIYSIGYGGRTVPDFIQLIIKYNISIIVDVRSNPISRFQPSFRKSNLQSILLEVGVQYIFLGDELGGKPKAQIFYTAGVLNQKMLTSTKVYQNGISELIELASVTENICIMCSELNPDHCHRKSMIGQTLFKRGIVVNHINSGGSLQKHISDDIYLNLF